MFRLLDASFGTERKRMEYYFSSIKEYEADSILDVGCGRGLLFESIRNPDDSKLLVGIDTIRNHKDHYEHITASATSLPIKNRVFSLITAFSLIEHIPKAVRHTFYREIKRATKKGGKFVIQFPNRYAIIESHTYMPFFGFLPSSMHSFAYRDEYVAVPSLKDVLQSLAKHGFHVYRIDKYKAPFLPFGSFLDKIGLFRIFPMGYIIHAEMEKTGNSNV